jgi:hypothetical protein
MNKLAAFLLFTVSLPLAAQWLDYADPRTPRTKDGKPNLTAPVPRLNGKPDLTGLWQVERSPASEYASVLGANYGNIQTDLHDITKQTINVFWGLKPEEEPLRPEAAAILRHRMESPAEYPHARCVPGSIPLSLFVFTFKMIQTPQEIVQISETADPTRQIYTDGRSLSKDPDPRWMGYSVGKWEGNTLVVETNGLNDQGWLDGMGHPRSEAMLITERYHRRDFGHMDLEITFNDPTYYTRPFSIKAAVRLIPDSDLIEYVCNENEKDRAHLATAQ